jgi:hypothetical protein
VQPLSPEFQVNLTHPRYQTSPSVAVLPNRSFVVTWTHLGSAGDEDIRARLFSRAAAPLGVDFRVNTFVGGWQGFPDVTALRPGGFVVAWEGVDASADAVRAQRYNNTGARQGGEFLLSRSPLKTQNHPAAAPVDPGFVAAWMHDCGTVREQVFDPLGRRIGPELQAHVTRTADQTGQAVARLSNGQYVVTWSDYGHVIRTYDSALWARRSAEKRSYTRRDFVVVWADSKYRPSPADDTPPSIRGRLYWITR